jgi:Ras-related protein Rab-1A
VYDITDRTSFDNVKVWLAEIDKYVDEHTVKFIVGNKNDLEEKRQVSEEEAYQFSTSPTMQRNNWERPSEKLQPG